MDSISSKITLDYTFTSQNGIISNRHKRDVPAILSVEALFIVKINNKLYFEAEIAILEFYKALFEWKNAIKEGFTPEFHYYTVEYSDYEEGAILSLVPFSNKARVKTIWAETDVYNVFDKTYVVNEFLKLEESLKNDIEGYFNINLKSFIKHIPYTFMNDEEY
ncbi:Uncharacterised protein [Niallia circulans]|uniref:DUF7878 domain-containing protein n=1 Tax=Shouchella clausii TaxID=79880 RepID=UPI000BA74E5B|nr:hypothetical protein [Shouchella clausii]PAF14346.1 hypothetical protein CHH59_09040 [Shouchella clausii]SPU19112.1 Uncharacterised protein [Niallia circulans]